MLIVDDDPRLVRSLTRWVNPLVVHAVGTLTAALPVIRGRCRLALAFVDFDLPDGCGFGVLRELVQHQPDAVRVLMSGREGVQRFAGAAQAHVFVAKPFESENIERIARRVSRRRLLEYWS